MSKELPKRGWFVLQDWLMHHKPSEIFELLRERNQLKILFPEINALWGVPQNIVYHPEVDTGVHTMMALDLTASRNLSVDIRYAVLVHDLGKALTPFEELPFHRGHEETGLPLVHKLNTELDVPESVALLAMLVCKEHLNVHRVEVASPRGVLRLLEKLNYPYRPDILEKVLLACKCDAQGRLGKENVVYTSIPYIMKVIDALATVDVRSISDTNPNARIREQKIHTAKIDAIRKIQEQ